MQIQNPINYPIHPFKVNPEYERARSIPVTNITQYIANSHAALASALRPITKIYLDLRYWIYFRDIEMGEERDAHLIEIYNLLKSLVEKNKVICPISTSFFMEFIKLKDSEKRNTEAEIVDLLSKGISIRYYEDVFVEEIVPLLLAIYKANEYESVLDYFPTMYSFASLTFGFSIPNNSLGFGQKELLDFHIDFYERFTNIPFTYLAKESGTLYEGGGVWENLSGKQKIQEQLHRGDIRSFEDAFKIELNGVFSISPLYEAMKNALILMNKLQEKPVSNNEIKEKGKRLMRIIYNRIYYKNMLNLLPSITVFTGLQAARRHKKYDPHKNDTYDYTHASVAVPYCEAFFTEKNLGTALVQGPLNYDEKFNCKVLWKSKNIIEYLQNLS